MDAAATAPAAGRDGLRGVALGYLAGYVDTLGFIGLFGLFTAHVTGNFVLIGRGLVRPAPDIAIKLLVFPVFIAFVALTRMLVLRWQRDGGPARALHRCLLLQLALLLAGTGLGWLASPVERPGAPLTLATGMACAAAMAVQNAYGKLLLGREAATTVMTGNVTQLVIELVDAVRGDMAARARAAGLLWPALAFAAGAVCGAWAFVLAGFGGLLAPCAILLALAFRAR
ncbi:DUF1275 domain-containing protein [Duganella sp. LX20W]|uniref:DUF1275 domain-containing protein n=1 Tax=Rugamonas brunnea TaxID=2758569 RepID=A0A7W2IC66_9BURK|nr:YoaK family protein [Rugamonas brunnea]MBA5637903.1 DUF1275 domain-containing protein [Rugamonas brunnea]